MIKLKTLTITNFLSIGKSTQTINLDTGMLTLVLGLNMDVNEENNSRNGAGKTAILNALCYALYGKAISKINRDNMINKTNQKNMLVTLDFKIGNDDYRIERGRRPNKLIWKINNNEVTSPDTDESEGDSSWTQKEIEKKIQISHNLFKHLVALNTYTEPFLSLPVSAQRAIIEELLGVTLISQKADSLRQLIKKTKDSKREEELRLEALKNANKKMQQTIDGLRKKSDDWELNKSKKQQDIAEQLESLYEVDIDKEIENHNFNQELKLLNESLEEIESKISNLETQKKRYERNLQKEQDNMNHLDDDQCPTCHQILNQDKKQLLTEQYKKDIDSLEKDIKNINDELETLLSERDELKEASTIERKPVKYNNLQEAYQHTSNVQHLETNLVDWSERTNEYLDQIETLMTQGISEIDYTLVNEISIELDHQEYLLKLLSDKNSFIRKKIIDQNLTLLNARLASYLETLGLPHTVRFKNDLSVEITELGRTFDFDNLSRGERNRLSIGLSLSFRDVYESMTQTINLLFVDEMIDNGMDGSGVESALNLLKKNVREKGKSVFLVSHREELINRVNNVMTIKRENGFSTIDYEEGAFES